MGRPKVLVMMAVLAGCAVEPRGVVGDFPIVAAPPGPGADVEPRGRRTHYTIRVALDAESHELAGTEQIEWINQSERPIRDLYFHLYLNAFRRGSRFLDPSLGGSRSGGLTGREGRLDISSVTSPQFPGQDLWELAAKHSPGLETDFTDIELPLPAELAPGARLQLQIQFHAVLPEIVERTGFSRDFHLLAQWFPKLAKFEPSGQFAHDSFHPFAEFYANFADYDVTLDVPSAYRVGSSGRLVEEKENAGRTTYTARGENMVDFAWTAFREAELTETDLAGVRVRLLAPPGAPRTKKLHLLTIEEGLQQFGRDYGPYPYPTLTVVVPPRHAQRAGGMEYPSFITTGGSEIGALLGTRQTELLVIHELGHQWFQSLIATNERESPFLDEGINSYAEWRFLRQNYGDAGLFSSPWLRVSREAGGRFAAFYRAEQSEVATQPAADFKTFRNLAQHVYSRFPLELMTLGRVYGPERLSAALSDYARTFRFQHPSPRDFEVVLVRHLGRTAKKPIARLLKSQGGFNLKFGQVETKSHGHFETKAEVLLSQALGLPFVVRADFSDGTSRVFSFGGQNKSEQFTLQHRVSLARLTIDPHHQILIDEDLRDNSYFPTAPPTQPRFRTLLTALCQLAFALLRS